MFLARAASTRVGTLSQISSRKAREAAQAIPTVRWRIKVSRGEISNPMRPKDRGAALDVRVGVVTGS
jgi:hypothetical protein